jgi:hypothetical protein
VNDLETTLIKRQTISCDRSKKVLKGLVSYDPRVAAFKKPFCYRFDLFAVLVGELRSLISQPDHEAG